MPSIKEIVDLVENHPMALLVLFFICVVVWLVKRLDKTMKEKDKIIAHLTKSLIKVHGEGAKLDETTQMLTGIIK